MPSGGREAAGKEAEALDPQIARVHKLIDERWLMLRGTHPSFDPGGWAGAIEMLLSKIDWDSVGPEFVKGVFSAAMADSHDGACANDPVHNEERRHSLADAADVEHAEICACCAARAKAVTQ